jgi:muconolactone delta-isomerase
VEFLVTMTTHVPDGTAEEAVNDIRAREAARSRELATEGHLLRLWRPPLQPGEWRTFGLFAADDDSQLELVLASMPLRVWRSDEVTPLRPHPNDPGSGMRMNGTSAEFLTTFTAAVPANTPTEAVADARAREKVRTHELAEEAHLERLWQLPGEGRALGLWRAADANQMQAIVASLPLDPYMTTEITPVTKHPSDPAASS